MPNPKMTPGEIFSSRQKLGLSRSQFAELLEITEEKVARMEAPRSDPTHMVPGLRTIRLTEAYLDGHRPRDWPLAKKDRIQKQRHAEVSRLRQELADLKVTRRAAREQGQTELYGVLERAVADLRHQLAEAVEKLPPEDRW